MSRYDCGWDAGVVPINVRLAGHNREHFLDDGLLAVNLMGSPCAGKTSILEAVARAAKNPRRIVAMTAEPAKENDANRLMAAGIRSKAIEMRRAAPLDAELVQRTLHHLDAGDAEYLFIESCGNLLGPVCDFGQSLNVVALSITEGEEKALHFPEMFEKADLVLLTKADLLPHLPFINVKAIMDALAQAMPSPRVISMSCRTGLGVEAFLRWLEAARAAALEKLLV